MSIKKIIGPIYHLLFATSLSVMVAIITSWPILLLTVVVQKTNITVNMSIAEVMHNYNQLLAYLVLPWDRKLRMDNFHSSKDALSHFADVKILFMLVIVVFVIGILVKVFNRKKKRIYPISKAWSLILLLLPIMFVPFAMANFDSFFATFHSIFFHNNYWQFNPTTDPIINVLTSGFFAACFAVFGLSYELYFAEKLMGK